MASRPLLPALCVIVGANTFSIGGFPALLPELGSVAGLADWELGILTGVFGFARMLSDLPAGLFIRGRLRQALLLAPLGIVGGVLCLGAGGPFWLLVLGRGLMAVGHTFGMLGGLTAVLRHAAPHRLGASLNVYEFSAMLGMLGGVALVGSLPASLPWNLAIITTCAPQVIGLLVLPIALRALPPERAAEAEPPGPGARPGPRPRSAAPASSLVALAFAAGTAIALTYTTVEQFLLPLRASREFGLGRSGVASLLMTSQLTDILALLPLGLLADRRGVARMVGLVLFAFVAGALLIGFGTLPLMTLGCASLGLGMAGWMLPLGVIRSVTSAERIGWLLALYRVSVDAGMFLGPVLSGLLGFARAGMLPLVLAAVMTALALALLRHPDGRRRLLVLIALALLPIETATPAFARGERSGPRLGPGDRGAAAADAGGAGADEADALTPIVLRVARPPIPVLGSDGRYHLLYELELTNMTRRAAIVRQVEVLDAGPGAVVRSYAAAAAAARLVVRQDDPAPGSLGPSQSGILYVHVAFETRKAIPARLAHRLLVASEALGQAPVRETGGRTGVAPPTDLVLAPPLRGRRLIAGDGCCEAVRHIRATLPINGRLFTAQRFAIDWEQLDDRDRIFVGDRADPASYVIYGAPVFAVANARVIAAVDGLPDTPPGALPGSIAIDQADGNHVILDLGDGRFALYAHLKPGSLRVRPGQRVRRGAILGLVGTSGNSSEPHLHFHVTDGPSALASSGVPYLIRTFRSRERGVSTEAFDRAIESGQPLEVEPLGGPPSRSRVLPLDLWIVDFD